MSEPVTIDIFGSCISRDILEFIPTNQLVCKNNIARSSFASAIAPPPRETITQSQISLKSRFLERSVCQDINKTGLAILAARPSEYLLVDFFEERFPLATMQGTIITLSNDFLHTHLPYENKIIWRSLSENLISDEEHFSYRTLFNQFLDRIKSIYPNEKIILNEAYLCDKYISANGIVKPFPHDLVAWGNDINNKMAELYACFKQSIPGCHVINISNNFFGSENNKWGLSNTHYEEALYRHSAQQLCNIIFGHPSRLICNAPLIYYGVRTYLASKAFCSKSNLLHRLGFHMKGR